MHLYVLYIASALIVGAIVSYEDLRHGLIRNKYVLLLLMLFLFYVLFNIHLYSKIGFLIHLVWALFVGFFLYLIDLWSAGDGKLFIVFSLLIPIRVLSQVTYLDFMINSFAPLFFSVFIYTLFTAGTKKIKESIEYAFRAYNVFLIVTIYLGIAWFILLPLSFIGIPTNLFTFIIAIFIVVEIFRRVTSVNLEYLFIFLAVLRLVIDYKNVFTLNFALGLTVTVFVFLFFRFFALKLTFKENVIRKGIENLEPGIEVAEGIKKKKDGYEKKELMQSTFYDFLYQKKESFVHSKTLTEDDIEKLRSLAEKGEIPREILVHKHIPFAVFIYFGFILTILIKTNFISILI